MAIVNTSKSVAMFTGGQAMVESLIDHRVDTVFGIPGVQLDPLFDAFHARRNQIRMVHTRHEQGAAFMALGYAQASDKTGVFAVVPGPGLLNAMAAVSTAVAANAPVLGITGQIPSYQIGRGFGMAHELRDQLAMSAGVVEWAKRANHPSEVPGLICDAFHHMHDGRKRPAILEVAPDQYAASAPVSFPSPAVQAAPPSPDADRIKSMVARLSCAKHPAIFVGCGIFGAERELRDLAEKLQAPVIASPSGLGAISDDHPLAFGILAGQDIWDEIDVALVVGTRFISPALSWGREAEVEVLRIDIDPLQIMRPRPASLSVVTSAKMGLSALLEYIDYEGPGREAYLQRCNTAQANVEARLATLGPLPLMSAALRRSLPRDAIVMTDVTQLAYYTRFGFPVYAPKSWFAPGYQATLGYGYPAALGAKLANPEKKVVAICGDGGFMFTVQELATAILHQIPVVCIVVDNQSYGNVKTIQAESFGARHIAVELASPDFVALAGSFGMMAERATTPEQLEEVLTRFLAADKPALISVPMGEVPSIWQFVKRPPSQGTVGR